MEPCHYLSPPKKCYLVIRSSALSARKSPNEPNSHDAHYSQWHCDPLNISRGVILAPPDTADAIPAPGTFTVVHKDDTGRVAHNVINRFKKEKKFSGILCGGFAKTIHSYINAANDYSLTHEQKLHILPNIYKRRTWSFFRRKVENDAQTFGEACYLMKCELDSVIVQKRVLRYLQIIQLKSITDEKGCSVSEALDKLKEKIRKFTSQGPPAHRTEEAKVEYLYEAVVGQKWTRDALAKSNRLFSV